MSNQVCFFINNGIYLYKHKSMSAINAICLPKQVKTESHYVTPDTMAQKTKKAFLILTVNKAFYIRINANK